MEHPQAKIYGEIQITQNRTLRKIEFEGHTYIHLKNNYPGCSDNLLHDPGCKCLSLIKKNNEEFGG